MKTSIKTIDIQAKEWFDKVNGNSYFSAQVTINFGLGGSLKKENTHIPSEYYEEKTIFVPMQYGHGNAFEYESFRQLQTDGILSSATIYSPTEFCRNNDIVLRMSKKDKCLKRDVKSWGSN